MLHGTLFHLAMAGLVMSSWSCGGKEGTAQNASKESQTGAPAQQKERAIRGDSTQQAPACRACRQTHCTNYQGLMDLVSTCFENADPKFSELCIAAKSCATQAGCGYGPLGSAECFCGSADLGACQTPGAANGPCQKQFYAAARTTSLSEVAAHFGDVTFPSGVAHYLHACDRDHCASECKVDSTKKPAP